MKFSNIIIAILIFSFTQSFAQLLFREYNEKIVNPNEIVASVDSIAITAEEFFYNYEFGPAFIKRQEDSKQVNLNFMLNEKLLALEGYKENLLNKSEIKSIYTAIESDLATAELFLDEVIPKINISEREKNEIVEQKKTELEIRWIYFRDENQIKNISQLLSKHDLFDSLYNSQINDTVFIDQRSMKTTEFNLNKNNHALAKLISTMKVGAISNPINIEDGWYIIKYDNRILSLIDTESETNKLNKEAKEALTKSKMDSISDSYVNELLFESNSTIKRDAFNILRSYLGSFVLPKEKYKIWELNKKLETSLFNLGISQNEKYPDIVLIESINRNSTLDDFLLWYQNRKLYIKFNKDNLQEYSKSLENCIWQMLRDKLLTDTAKKKGYFENSWVKKQSKWWKDKVVYSALRSEYANSIILANNEIVDTNVSEKIINEKMSNKLAAKILHKVIELKKKYKIKINNSVLDNIRVSSEEDGKAIDLYSIKNGGLIPRPAYPSIDADWSAWQ